MPRLLLTALLAASILRAAEPGLLFHLSGDKGFTADFAAGDPEPNFLKDVKIVRDGAKGAAFECAGTQLMAYRAPGNIHAQRGTLAFYWRSREPVGPTAFPIFRVGYADHSSWDMVWLRIDYNGESGFDAFVTDASLSRIRVRYRMPRFPAPNQWTHFALAWDETRGVQFYVNGALAAAKDTPALLDAALDQFGPHSRIISPMNVQSAYNFIRGGDIDEVRIYDRMLAPANIVALSRGEAAGEVPALARTLEDETWRREWLWRYGWNRADDPPPYLDAQSTRVRKVEIHDVYDLKRWWWKATDGIRETTWPGVYNRSRLPGRNDYFQLPDWDCYTLSGKSVTFHLPDEPWNHLEISGAAWGKWTLEPAKPLFETPQGQERTYHRLSPIRGQKLRFDNIEQETPIGELSAYQVEPGAEPAGVTRLTYTLTARAEPSYHALAELNAWIRGRYPIDERSTVIALPAGAPRKRAEPVHGLPIVHILIPSDFRDDADFSYTWRGMNAGLDGIAIDLPALRVEPTHGPYFAMNIQVKDPIWPLRNMLDFSFSVKPGEARTLWLDLRDRVLPDDRGLYLTIAGAGPDFGPQSLEGAQIRFIFKPRAEAAREHLLDRFTQLRDAYAQLVEEHANQRRLDLYKRFEGDVLDALRVDPDHFLTRAYWCDMNKNQPKPPVRLPQPPPGVPLWAFRQVEALRYAGRLADWYIDQRQIDNGELGGGLSDDGDLTNYWPPIAFMGWKPAKLKQSLLRELDAFYNNGMFTNGLSTIQADELHSYEEGIQALGQSLLLDDGSPRQLERAMETSRRLIWLTGVNAAGHRHIRSSYFNGEKMAEEEPWGWSKASSYLVFHPALLLVRYNGNPTMRKLIVELADGLAAHRRKNAQGRFTTNTSIRFKDDADLPEPPTRAQAILWAAFRWTGDAKYLEPLRDDGYRMADSVTANIVDLMGLRNEWSASIPRFARPDSPGASIRHLAWQVTGDKRYLESLYLDQMEAAALREYINTEGSLWIDRPQFITSELQRARLGGIAQIRNAVYPGHAVSWSFEAPASASSVAILIPDATPEAASIEAYNLDQSPVKAWMTPWDLAPGEWEITQDGAVRTLDIDRGEPIAFTFAPHTTSKIRLKQIAKGVSTWDRPDLGVDHQDIAVNGAVVTVRVHSLGSVDAPATPIAIVAANGRTIATAMTPPLKAPLDLTPKTADVRLTVADPSQLRGAAVVIDPARKLHEISRANNRAGL